MQGSLLDASTRVACVQIPALSLQLVLRAHPEWSEDPVVVVQDDRPLAAIVECNRVARAHRMHRGMNFSHAKALSAKLHAEVLSEPALDAAIDALFDRLLSFSPHVEPVLLQPGLFWLDPQGLHGIFGNLQRWAAQVHDALTHERFVASVVVGFRRGPSWTIGSVRMGANVLRDPEEETRSCARVPIARLAIAPRLRDEFALLGITHVGDLLALPVSQLRVRYGADAARLHDFLNGKTWSPLLPRTPMAPLVVTLEVDPPDDDHVRLLFGLKGLLHGVAERLASEHQAITAIDLLFELERLGNQHERLESAAPTLDVPQLVDLLRLRLSSVTLAARVERILVTIEHTRVHPRQIAIQHGPKPRDLDAAARAIARLRASFGPEAVSYARLRETHLPEAAFRFEPARELRLPRPQCLGAELPLVRRVYPSPRTLPPLPRHEPEAWLGHHGAVTRLLGPHRIAGGWWSPRGARERDYYFAETKKHEVLWVYYDAKGRCWRLQGVVD